MNVILWNTLPKAISHLWKLVRKWCLIPGNVHHIVLICPRVKSHSLTLLNNWSVHLFTNAQVTVVLTQKIETTLL